MDPVKDITKCFPFSSFENPLDWTVPSEFQVLARQPIYDLLQKRSSALNEIIGLVGGWAGLLTQIYESAYKNYLATYDEALLCVNRAIIEIWVRAKFGETRDSYHRAGDTMEVDQVTNDLIVNQLMLIPAKLRMECPDIHQVLAGINSRDREIFLLAAEHGLSLSQIYRTINFSMPRHGRELLTSSRPYLAK